MDKTLANFVNFCKNYWKDHLPGGMRYGQAFCNAFEITNPDLFYEKDQLKAEAMINDIVVDTFLFPSDKKKA